MKPAVVIGVLLVVLSPLAGVSMKANSIGQMLGGYEEGDRYRLDVSAYSRVLFEDGRQVWVEIDRYIEPATKVTTRTYRDGRILRRTFTDGSLVKEEEEGTVSTYTLDEGGRLIVSSTASGEDEPILAYYSYDRKRPNLISIARLGEGGLVLSRFVREPEGSRFSVVDEEGGQVYVTMGTLKMSDGWKEGEALAPVTVDETEEGFLRLVQDDRIRIYSRSGQLLKERTDAYERTFSYTPEGVLKEIRTDYPDDRVVIDIHDDRSLVLRQELQGGLPVKDTRYHEDFGYTETLYDLKGMPYADVTWAPGGMRVTSIRYH
ncbi:MAG: hypothetical protein GX911_07845 [Spirochaetales bacterium]|nr:hypothetical protein [Spirochaetales bacterium]